MFSVFNRSLVILAVTITPSLAQVGAPAAPNPAGAPAAAVAAPPQAFKTLVDRVEMKDGDTWVFLGDSITHQCQYTQYVENFYYTRYPKMKVRFHNAGVGGDRAADALARFDADVASYKPKYVTILLGMNDGGYTNYQQPIFDAYQRDMTTVLDKIAAIGATAIPMTPTMFDSRASKQMNRPNTEMKERYYNGVLSLFGSWLREQALERGLGFVDMWSPLNNLTFEQRKKDPNWTMIGDAVHPGASGQAVMAVAVLNDIVPKSVVSQIIITQEGGKPASRAVRGTIGKLEKGNNSLSWDFTAEALPWVLTSDAAEGYKLTHAGHRNSNEKVTVRDLAPGRYDLKIDGQLIGTYTSGQLAAGVELEENSKTPQFQQAVKVAELNKQKNDEAMRPLRNAWRDLKVKRREIAQAEASKSPALPQLKESFEKWQGEFEATVKTLQAKVREFEEKIYQGNQPSAHHYEVALAAAAGAGAQ